MLLFYPLSWVLGTALQLQQSALWAGWYYAVAMAVAIVGLILVWRSGKARTVLPKLAALLACAVVGFCLTALRSHRYLSESLQPALEGRDVWLSGVVTGLPQRTELGLRFRLEVSEAVLNGSAVALPPVIDVAWYGGVYALGNERVGLQRQAPDLRPGEQWRLLVRLKAPHGSSNPSGFDYELWLWEQGVGATGYVRAGPNDPVPERLTQTWWHPVDALRQSVRDTIFERVQAPQAAGLIAALVVGDQRAIDRADWDVFRATGVAHLMSISGLHITMFAWIAALLVGALWRRSIRLCTVLPAPVAALWGGLLLAVLYAVFSGWGLPAQRTCLMLAAVAVLRVSGARWPWPQVWMLACAVVVACDPWALLQAGFWLSFVAVAVLFATSQPPPTDPVAQDPLSNGAALGDGFTPEHAIGEGALNPAVLRAMERLWRMVQEQWTITLALAPLTALLFGQVSLIGLVANLVAIPWVTLVVTPLAMLGVVVPDAWSLAVAAIDLLMAGLNGLAALPLASVVFAAVPVWAGALGVLGAVVLVASLPWPVRGLGVPLLLPVLLWQAPLPATGHFELLAADIGQGNAVLVRTATHALLYDAGPRYSFESDAGHRVLVPLLQALQTRLDLVLLSHRDTDHVGGAAAVLAMQVDAQLVSSIREDHPLQTLRSARRCEAGQTWSWDGVQFEILHPRAADYPEPGAPDPKPNSVSCVLRVTNGAQTALLVGDIEAPQEDALLGRGAPLRADVLLVPHHGSKTSSSAAFLDAVRPRFGLVQAGYRNRFGHPAPDVAQRYADRRIEVHDSPHCGAMTWHSAQPLRVECTRMMQMHYWSHRVP